MKTDQYGLHQRIKVRVTEDRYGGLLLTPLSQSVRNKITVSNLHDQSAEFYCQSPFDALTGVDFSQLPKRMLYRGEINDGAIVLIDSWIFRHLVGGQYD